MTTIPKLNPSSLGQLPYEVQEWARQSTDSINARFGLVLDPQSPNIVYAGPSSGAAAVPSFRSLVRADIPALITSDLPAIAKYEVDLVDINTADTGLTTIFTAAAAGGYLLNVYFFWNGHVSGAAATTLTLVSTWNDGYGSQSRTDVSSDTIKIPTKYSDYIRLGAGQSLKYQVTHIGANDRWYDVYISVIRLS